MATSAFPQSCCEISMLWRHYHDLARLSGVSFNFWGSFQTLIHTSSDFSLVDLVFLVFCIITNTHFCAVCIITYLYPNIREQNSTLSI